jgi:hypothetical protein
MGPGSVDNRPVDVSKLLMLHELALLYPRILTGGNLSIHSRSKVALVLAYCQSFAGSKVMSITVWERPGK